MRVKSWGMTQYALTNRDAPTPSLPRREREQLKDPVSSRVGIPELLSCIIYWRSRFEVTVR